MPQLIKRNNLDAIMATEQFLVLVVLVVSNCVSSKPSEEFRINLNVNVNIDKGQTKNESVELVRDVAKPKALDPMALRHFTLVPPPINVARKLMTETKDVGSCIECVRKNTASLMRCVHLLRKGSDYKKCFRDLAKISFKEKGIDDFVKCATCTCKQLERMGVNVEKYPELHKEFCFLANENDLCSDVGTTESEHFPKCRKGLYCDRSNVATDIGFCAKGNQIEQSNATSRNVNVSDLLKWLKLVP